MSEGPLYSPQVCRPSIHHLRNPFSFLLSSLEVSDTKVYEPEIRALLGTVSHFRRDAIGPHGRAEKMFRLPGSHLKFVSV